MVLEYGTRLVGVAATPVFFRCQKEPCVTVDVGRSDYGEPFPIAPISVEYVLWVGSRHKDAPQIRAIPFFGNKQDEALVILQRSAQVTGMKVKVLSVGVHLKYGL